MELGWSGEFNICILILNFLTWSSAQHCDAPDPPHGRALGFGAGCKKENWGKKVQIVSCVQYTLHLPIFKKVVCQSSECQSFLILGALLKRGKKCPMNIKL